MFRCFVAAVGVLLAGGIAEAGVSARILLGVGDTAETVWDGEIIVRGAQIAALDPWRFDGGDAMLGGNRWKMSTHPVRVFSSAAAGAPAARPVVPNGVIVQLD